MFRGWGIGIFLNVLLGVGFFSNDFFKYRGSRGERFWCRRCVGVIGFNIVFFLGFRQRYFFWGVRGFDFFIYYFGLICLGVFVFRQSDLFERDIGFELNQADFSGVLLVLFVCWRFRMESRFVRIDQRRQRIKIYGRRNMGLTISLEF